MKVNLRIAAAVALGLAMGVLSPAAQAALKPVACHIVEDPAGDAAIAPGAPNDDAADILSVDFANSPKFVTGVLRLKKLPPITVPPSVGATFYIYYIYFTGTGPDSIFLRAVYDASTDTYSFEYGYHSASNGVGDIDGGPAVGGVDTAKNEIFITVPTNSVSLVAGQKRQISAQSTTSVGLFAPPLDSTSTTTYVAGTRSCVTPGRTT